MAYTLGGYRYRGVGEFPPPAAGYDLIEINTGDWYVSDSSGTIWNLVGNINEQYIGLAPVSGYNATGALTGAHGLATLDNPNFYGGAAVDSDPVVTESILAASVTGILDSIGPKITEAIAKTVSAVSVKSNIAIATGILNFYGGNTLTIPLPLYPDGSMAEESDCKWSIGALHWYSNTGRSDSNGDQTVYHSADPTTTRTFSIWMTDRGGNHYPLRYVYFIIAVRS